MRAVLRALMFALLLAGAGAVRSADPPDASRADAAKATAPGIPFRKDDDLGALAIKVAGGLVVALALGVGALVVLKRTLRTIQQAPGKRLRVLESVRLTPKATLFLVELDGQALLIGQQGESLVRLDGAAPGVSTAASAAPAAPVAPVAHTDGGGTHAS